MACCRSGPARGGVIVAHAAEGRDQRQRVHHGLTRRVLDRRSGLRSGSSRELDRQPDLAERALRLTPEAALQRFAKSFLTGAAGLGGVASKPALRVRLLRLYGSGERRREGREQRAFASKTESSAS